MASQTPLNIQQQQNFRQYLGKNNLKYVPKTNNPYNTMSNDKQNIYMEGSTRASNDISSTDIDSFSYKNNILNTNYEKSKNVENRILLKNPNEFVSELIKTFGEKNSICNFKLFEKNIDISMNIDKNTIKKMTLYEYFEGFNEASFLCLNIPYLDKKCNINYIVFNPTLSSMNLVIKNSNKKIKEESINKEFLKDNFSVNFISSDLIQVEFDETIPPYNRDIIEIKINNIYKILGLKKSDITLDNIVLDKSYFSVLWTPADTYKIRSSFLTFYTFEFKLIGTLIIKNDEYNWFTVFCSDANYFKDFKKEYLNKVNIVETFIKNCYNINDRDNLESKLFSNDYKRFMFNY
jgi:hypothetical protein